MKKLRLKSEFVGAQHDFMDDLTSKFLHLSAGYGFGKSRTLVYKVLLLSYLNKDMPGGIVVPSYTDFTRDVKIAFEDVFNENNIQADYHGSEHKYKFPWTKGALYVATAEKKIRGPNWAYAGINELTLISLERYREVIGRVRIKEAQYPQICSSGTPEGLASDYYEIFVEKPWAGSRILYGDTRENEHNLNPGYIQNLYNSYPKALLDAYMKGLWVNLQGNRFYFAYDPIKNDKQNKVRDDLNYIAAMDMNVDPFCVSIWQHVGNKFVGIDEIALEGGEGYKVENMVAAMQTRGYGPINTVVCPDPSAKNRNVTGKTVAQILKDAGYQVQMKPAAPRFRERQINMNNHFEKGLIEVNPVTQPKTKKDFMAVEVDQITFEKSKANPKLTHFSDGVDYMVDVYAPFNKHKAANYTTQIR